MSTPCSVSSCDVPSRARGWCIPHYHRWHRWGDPEGQAPRFAPKTCSIDGCDRPHHAKGWCRLHWRRARDSGGDPQAGRPMRGQLSDDGKKWCVACSTLMPLVAFTRSRTRPGGRGGHCKSCQRAWRRQNRDRLLEGKRAWYQANREQHRQQAAEWRRRNADRNRAIATAATSAYMARKRGAAGTATVDQIAARWDVHGGRCWMCGEPATQTDHVKPLSAGGTNWPANLRPACQPCNQSKSGRWPLPR